MDWSANSDGGALIFWLVVAWLVFAPDRVTLAATRGAAGAVLGAAGRKPNAKWTRGPSRPKAERTGIVGRLRQRLGAGRGSKSSWRRRHPRLGAAVDGWRAGAAAARAKREDGADLHSHTRQHAARGLTKAAEISKSPKVSAGLAGAAGWLQRHDRDADETSDYAESPTDETEAEAPVTTSATEAEEPTTPATAGGIENKENDMQSITELESLDAVEAEAKQASDMCQTLMEVLPAAKAWASGLADRWAGTSWGTRELDAAVAAASDAAEAIGDAEALAVAIAQIITSVERARVVGEAADEVGAKGDIEHYKAA